MHTVALCHNVGQSRDWPRQTYESPGAYAAFRPVVQQVVNVDKEGLDARDTPGSRWPRPEFAAKGAPHRPDDAALLVRLPADVVTCEHGRRRRRARMPDRSAACSTVSCSSHPPFGKIHSRPSWAPVSTNRRWPSSPRMTGTAMATRRHPSASYRPSGRISAQWHILLLR